MTSNQQRTFLPLVLFLTIFIRTNARGGINHPAMAGQPGMQGPGGDHQGSIPNDPSLPRFFDVPNNSTAHADDVDKTKYDIHKNNQPGVQGDDPSMTKPEPTVGSSREINPQKVTDRPRGAATCVTITNHLLIASISFAFFHRIKNSIF
uniref:Uncharacterized protein n=1 Tax=Strigamia maritima TaxID=126957 RepID=T1J1K7_STRMM